MHNTTYNIIFSRSRVTFFPTSAVEYHHFFGEYSIILEISLMWYISSSMCHTAFICSTYSNGSKNSKFSIHFNCSKVICICTVYKNYFRTQNHRHEKEWTHFLEISFIKYLILYISVGLGYKKTFSLSLWRIKFMWSWEKSLSGKKLISGHERGWKGTS